MIAGVQRKRLRPHGILSAACHACPFFESCGGIEPEQSLLSCFDLCQQDCATCDAVCPRRPDFAEAVAEIGGFSYTPSTPISQHIDGLPSYIPVVHHGYKRREVVNDKYVALDTYSLFRLKEGKYRCVAKSPEQLRTKYKLGSHVRVILRGTARDRLLERFWSYRQRDGAATQLAQLGIHAAIGPNYSHFLGIARTDNLFNRKRQLICLEEFQKAGVCPIPHLNAVTNADWDFWGDYLSANVNVNTVSVEFQTGNRNPSEGERAISHILGIQDRIGRSLHLIAIGGARFTGYLARKELRFSIMDSRPFMSAVKRRAIIKDCFCRDRICWISRPTRLGEYIDGLMKQNLTVYQQWIEQTFRSSHARSSYRAMTASL